MKLPDSKKARRYKGGIYCEEFRSIGEFENISKRTEQRIDEYNRRDTQGEIRFYTNKLNEYTERKAEYIQSKYPRRVESKEQISVDNNRNNESSNIDYNNDILFPNPKSNAKFTNLASTFKFTVPSTESKIPQNTDKRSNAISRQINNIYKNKGELINDSTRTTIKSGITKERKTKYRAYTKARKARAGVYQQITANAESLRNKFAEYSEQEHRNKQSIIRKIGDIGKIITKLASILKDKINKLIKSEELSFVDKQVKQKFRKKE